jgi:hypothetical protein
MLAYRHTQRSCCSSRIMPLSSTVLMRYLLYVAQSLDLNKVKRTDKFLIHLELKTHPIFLLVLRVLFDAFFFIFLFEFIIEIPTRLICFCSFLSSFLIYSFTFQVSTNPCQPTLYANLFPSFIFYNIPGQPSFKC